MSQHRDKKAHVARQVARMNGHAPVPEQVPSLSPTRPPLICPGHDCGHTITVEQIAPTVQRRRHSHTMESAQTAAE